MVGAFSKTRACIAMAFALLLVGLGGCDKLGNPPMGYARTDWTRWSEGPYATLSRARSAPVDRWRSLLQEMPVRELHHADRLAQRGGVVAIVTVRDESRVRLPQTVELVTEFQLRTGGVERRRWRAPAHAAQWYGAFALPTPPRSAVTAILR